MPRSARLRTILRIVLAVAIGAVVSPALTSEAHAALTCDTTVCKIYMAPQDGEPDAEAGTPTEPVHSLAAAQTLLSAPEVQNHNVEIRIKAGLYIAAQTSWTTFLPGYSISFMPDDYTIGENESGIAARPIFQGAASNNHAWISIAGTEGVGINTSLRFYYLQIQNYKRYGVYVNGGIEVVDGRRVPNGSGLNQNRFEGLLIRNIGSKHSGDDANFGYAGIELQNSRNNVLKNNTFEALENKSSLDGGLSQTKIHGVYLAHGSSDNDIIGNTFEAISGNPVDVRNESNNNNISGNTFNQNGGQSTQMGHYFDWFDPNAGSDGYECESFNNFFWNNTLGQNYNNTGPLPEKYVLTNTSNRPECTWTNQTRVSLNGNTWQTP